MEDGSTQKRASPGRRRRVRMTRKEFLEIRLELGLTQQAMADRLGLMFQANVGKIETTTGPSGPVSAHMRTLLRNHREYMQNMARAKGGER